MSFNITSELQRNKIFSILLHWGTPGLNTLVMRCCGLECKHLHRLCQQPRRCFLGLRTLDISVNPRISVYVLMRHNFPQLNILIIRKCELSTKDPSSLAQASNLGRLPELRHLDLSLNSIGIPTLGFFKLLSDLKCFSSLINLVLCDCHLKLQDLCCLTQARLDGKLPGSDIWIFPLTDCLITWVFCHVIPSHSVKPAGEASSVTIQKINDKL